MLSKDKRQNNTMQKNNPKKKIIPPITEGITLYKYTQIDFSLRERR